MALTCSTESEAPRDFRISSIESDAHYTKCLLCYTIKKNFYCVDCLRSGNFVHSSMPYSDRYAEKQAKLYRFKSNRKHTLDRCEVLLRAKSKKDNLQTEVKLSKDRVELIKLAIEQKKNQLAERKIELSELVKNNSDLKLKLPRYQKRVASLSKHFHIQREELESKIKYFDDKADELAALRRARIRQLNRYIFPVYLSYDNCDSIDDLEFLQVDGGEGGGERLHILSTWLPASNDYTQLKALLRDHTDSSAVLEPASSSRLRSMAALGLCAQLCLLLSWILDVTLPAPLSLSSYWLRVGSPGALWAVAGAWRGAVGTEGPGGTGAGGTGTGGTGTGGVATLHHLVVAANTHLPHLGRCRIPYETYTESGGCEEWGGGQVEDEEPPEHITWPTVEPQEQISPVPAGASLVSSLASFWRGWHK